MNVRFLVPRLLLISGGAAVAWAVIPGSSEASPPSWQAAHAGAVSFLQQSPAQAWATSSGGAGRNHLPTSVMPNGMPGLQCSVDTSDPAPALCSTNVAAVRCSAHCDNAQRCSAFINSAGLGTAAQCSTMGGGNGARCSVLQPVIQPTAASLCSAFGGIPGTDIQCSIMGIANNQACSAENQGRFQTNQCSTFPVGTVILRCSVLKGGPNTKNYCSVANMVQPGFTPKQCSTFAPNSNCSVQPGSRGFCTVFAPAPAGTCSVFAGGSTCSVIGGLNGVFCKWP